jgi:hypothetical protein
MIAECHYCKKDIEMGKLKEEWEWIHVGEKWAKAHLGCMENKK